MIPVNNDNANDYIPKIPPVSIWGGVIILSVFIVGLTIWAVTRQPKGPSIISAHRGLDSLTVSRKKATRADSSEFSLGNQTVISFRITDANGNPIDSNSVIPPTPGIRNVYLYTGHSWERCDYGSRRMDDSFHYQLYIFEFIDTGSKLFKGGVFYHMNRIGCSNRKFYKLCADIWDCKVFAAGVLENYGDSTLDGFGVEMRGSCGHGNLTGSLTKLRRRVESFFHPNAGKLRLASGSTPILAEDDSIEMDQDSTYYITISGKKYKIKTGGTHADSAGQDTIRRIILGPNTFPSVYPDTTRLKTSTSQNNQP